MITYQTTKIFSPQQLEALFLSVAWSSGHYPEKLAEAMRNYGSVISAWDGNKLIGLICVMDDGVMTAYIHYLLVDPKYQSQGIGKKLLALTTNRYKDYLRIILIAYENQSLFYQRCGFEAVQCAVPMQITSLST